MKRRIWWILCAVLTVAALMLALTVREDVVRAYAALSDDTGASGIDYFGVGWAYVFRYLMPAAVVHVGGIVCALVGALRTDSRVQRVIFCAWAGLFFVTVPLVVLSLA